MSYYTNWDKLPEVEVLTNNFRRSAAGLQAGVNRIRLVHPSGTPIHQHDDAEQLVILLSGRLHVTIDGETREMGAGDICVMPIGVPHRFETIEGEVVLIEIFAPMRVQNLVGFVGKIF